jgi:inosine-uridine nucleoside N-ribohydrolase
MFLKPTLLVLALSCPLMGRPQHRRAPVPVIFDSDIGPDYDDAGAITILHVLADEGQARILATVASNRYEGIAAVLNLFNTYFHRPDIPVGVPDSGAVSQPDWRHWTGLVLARYPHRITSNQEVPGSVTVYRRVLSAQPDHSVTVVTVGFLTNLAGLLHSGPDAYSPLNGQELVKKKVKLLVSMAGKYPSGREYNIYNDAPSAAYALENWPTPVILSGYEIGADIKTGLPLIRDRAIRNDPVKDAFAHNMALSRQDAEGRMSWDEVTVLVAIRGYKPYFSLREGRVAVAPDRSDSWHPDGKGQFYLTQQEPPKKIERLLNRLMMQQPAHR